MEIKKKLWCITIFTAERTCFLRFCQLCSLLKINGDLSHILREKFWIGFLRIELNFKNLLSTLVLRCNYFLYQLPDTVKQLTKWYNRWTCSGNTMDVKSETFVLMLAVLKLLLFMYYQGFYVPQLMYRHNNVTKVGSHLSVYRIRDNHKEYV